MTLALSEQPALFPSHTRAAVLAAALLVSACGGVARDDPAGGTRSASSTGGAPTCDAVNADPENCGYCGHDCRGAACEAGLCAPDVLATDPKRPSSLAVDAQRVYWTDADADGAVQAVPKAGGVAVVLVSPAGSGWGYGHRIGVSASDLVWMSGDNHVMRLSLAGGEPVALPSGTAGPAGMTTDAATAYYSFGPIDGSVFSLVKLALPDEPPVVLASVPALDLTVDATDVYYTRCDAGGVERVPLAGGPVASVTDAYCPLRIALAAGHLYFSDEEYPSGLLAIRRVALSGAGAVSVVPASEIGEIAPAFTADEDALYYAAGGELRRLPHHGGPAVALAKVDEATDVVVDDAFVYWTEAGAAGGGSPGAVKRVAK